MRIPRLASALLPVLLLPLAALSEGHPQADRIVTIGGPVTEIVFALGEGDRVVARDTTSTFPDAVNALPDVGYMRQLSAEGVLSVAPDLILARETSGPPEAMDQLRAAAVPLVEVPDAFTAENVIAAVKTVGAAIGADAKAEALAADLDAQFAQLAARVADGARPRVLFVLSNQAGRLNVAGRGTGADGILALAGAENVMGAAYEGYKILSDEAIIAAAPDVLLMMEPTGSEGHDSRVEDLLALPAIARTPAGEKGAVALVDPAALGFGPRTADLASGLRAALLAAGQ